jgi:adenosylmethionine-8-amino-7-oxononanoate aminotransferase
MFGGLTHEPAVMLAEKLVEITPEALQNVFFADSGSVSVEVALKMAIQYWHARSKSNKKHFLTIRYGYHGDTFQAMSVCDPDTGMHHLFSGVLSKQIFCDAPQPGFRDPWGEDFLADFRSKLQANHGQLAAVILEPIVQGAGGMRFYHPEFLAGVRQLCDEYKVLLIADEIATGLGRTGKMFGCDHAQVSPDILCLGKTLTGGYMTLAATLCSDEVANGICQGEAGVFMHGPTYMANPLACAVALRSIELLEQANHVADMPRLEAMMGDLLAPCRQFACVADVRTLGGIGVVELKQPLDLAIHQDLFVQQGIWVRPFGKLVYIMPPYVINDEDLAFLCAGIVRVIEQLD